MNIKYQHAAFYSFVLFSSAFSYQSSSTVSSVTFSLSTITASVERLSLMAIMPFIAKFKRTDFFAFHGELNISLNKFVSRETPLSEAISLITLQLFVSLVVLPRSRRATAPWTKDLGELDSKFSIAGSKFLENPVWGGP